MFRQIFWQYALKEVLSRKGRSIGVVLGMAVGIGMFVAIFTLADGYHRLILLPFKQLKMDVAIQQSGSKVTNAAPNGIHLPPANHPISGQQADRIRSFPEWEAIGQALMLWEHSPTGFSVICGVDLAGGDIGPSGVQNWVSQGRALSQNGQVLLEKHFSRVNGYKPGRTISVGWKTFDIVGLVELKQENAISKADIYMSIEDARALAGLPPGSANMLFATLKKGLDPEAIRARLLEVLPGGLLTTTDNIGQMMKGFGRISGAFAKGFSGLCLVFAAMVCLRLLTGSVYERRKDIGIMKVVGWRHRDISRSITLEALLLSLLGGLAGVVLGYALACFFGSFEIALKLPWNLSPMPVTAAKSDLVRLRLPVAFSIQIAGISMVVSSIFGVLAGKMVSRKLSTLKPMIAIRDI